MKGMAIYGGNSINLLVENEIYQHINLGVKCIIPTPVNPFSQNEVESVSRALVTRVRFFLLAVLVGLT